jgi:hypothetical protein
MPSSGSIHTAISPWTPLPDRPFRPNVTFRRMLSRNAR